jgi:hypothetical protein
MDAKVRYRRRQLLRLALADAWRLLGLNVLDGIEPDQQTAQVATELLKKLVPFAVLGTKQDLAVLLREPPDVSVIAGLVESRRRERARKKPRRR